MKAVASYASHYYGKHELMRPIVAADQGQVRNGEESTATQPPRIAQASTSRLPLGGLVERAESSDEDEEEDDVERELATGRKDTVAPKLTHAQLSHAKLKARRAALSPEERALEQEARSEYNRVYRKVLKARKLINVLQTEAKEHLAKDIEAQSQSTQQRLNDATQELQALQEEAKQAKQRSKEIIDKVPFNVAISTVANIAESSAMAGEGHDTDPAADEADLNMLNRMDISALVALGELQGVAPHLLNGCSPSPALLAIFVEECIEAHIPLKDAAGSINTDLIACGSAAPDRGLADRIQSTFLPLLVDVPGETSEDDREANPEDDEDRITDDDM